MRPTSSKLLAQLAWKAANNLCDKHGKALSSAFGNFDRVVALGWLLGDAAGAPLLTRTHAHAVGIKARRVAGETTAELALVKRSAQRAASKLEADNPRRQELAAEAKEAEASLLRATVQFPALRAEQSTQPLASGSRKRKVEPDAQALSQDEELSLLNEKVLKAEKEVKRARAAVASAENEVDEQARKAMRLATQLDNHDIRGPGWNPLYAAAKRQHKLWDKCSSVVTAAEAVVQERLLLLKDAQMDSMLMEVEMGLVFF